MGEIERRNEVAVKERKCVISLKFKERKNDLSQFTGSKMDKIEKEKKKTLYFPQESVRHGSAIYMRCRAPSALHSRSRTFVFLARLIAACSSPVARAQKTTASQRRNK